MSDEPEVVDRQDAETDEPMVAALLRERASYVVRGLDDRVAQVDEQLGLRGHAATTPKRRKSPTQQTR